MKSMCFARNQRL